MKKSQKIIAAVLLVLIFFAVEAYDSKKVACYEIVKDVELLSGDLLLDKCKGRTWTLVKHEATMEELGYVSDNEEKIDTLIWTQVERGHGILTFEKSKK